MKSHKILKRCLAAYLVVWLLSSICIRPGRIEASIEPTITHENKYSPMLQQSICIAPALFIIDWQEGTEVFDSAGYDGLVFYTPWGAYLIMKRMTWIS